MCVHIRFGQLLKDKKLEEGSVFTKGLAHFERNPQFTEVTKNARACLADISARDARVAGAAAVNWVLFTDALAVTEYFEELNASGSLGASVRVVNANARATV